jgi:hypothetical protein
VQTNLHTTCLAFTCSVVSLFWAASSTFASEGEFRERVAPILESRCLRCHEGSAAEGGLSLASRHQLFHGGDSGPAIDVERVVAGGAAIRESTLSNSTVLESGFGEDYYAAIIAILSEAAPLSQGLGGEEMIQAGMEDVSPGQFFAGIAVAALLATAGFYFAGMPFLGYWGLAAIPVVLVFGLPKFFLGYRIKSRAKAFTRLFADANDGSRGR